MDMSFEELVRERAYHIWMSAGMEDGMAHEHWSRAERAVTAETAKPAKKVAAKKAAPKVAEKAPVKTSPARAKTAAKTPKVKH